MSLEPGGSPGQRPPLPFPLQEGGRRGSQEEGFSLLEETSHLPSLWGANPHHVGLGTAPEFTGPPATPLKTLSLDVEFSEKHTLRVRVNSQERLV